MPTSRDPRRRDVPPTSGASSLGARGGCSAESDYRVRVHVSQLRARQQYLATLCEAMLECGAPTHRLEEYLAQSAAVLGVAGAQFLYLPGSVMLLSFGGGGGGSSRRGDDREGVSTGPSSSSSSAGVRLVRAARPGLDLRKMRDVHHVYKQVVHDRTSAAAATAALGAIRRRRAGPFPAWARVAAYGVVSAAVAPVAFGGRFVDLPVCFALGCGLGVLQLGLAPRNPLCAHVLDVVAVVASSFLARLLGSLRGGRLFCFSALAQSAVALILPGFMVVSAALELQAQKIVAGSVRMVYALIYTLALGYSITLGATLYGKIDREASSAVACQDPLDRRWSFLFVPVLCAGLCTIFQATWKQWPLILVISFAGFCANLLSDPWFHGKKQISTVLGSLTVGILANLYSRLGSRVERWFNELVHWFRRKGGSGFLRAKRRPSDVPLPRHRYESETKCPGFETYDSSSCSVPSTPSSPGFCQDSSESEKKMQYVRKSSPAAAIMVVAIFAQVPSDLAIGGSLLWGIKNADVNNAGVHEMSSMDMSSLNTMLNVIEIAIGITIGLFLSAVIVYPLGKRRSGLLSF
ncbi:pheromone-regulated membrane protein [Xylariomycetidae sp. FL0641]|nr:pheromone-regulated membrane protein [Xylariomycetidae sp. FL0641]